NDAAEVLARLAHAAYDVGVEAVDYGSVADVYAPLQHEHFAQVQHGDTRRHPHTGLDVQTPIGGRLDRFKKPHDCAVVSRYDRIGYVRPRVTRIKPILQFQFRSRQIVTGDTEIIDRARRHLHGHI